MKTIDIIRELSLIYDIDNLDKNNAFKIFKGKTKFVKYCELMNLFLNKIEFKTVGFDIYAFDTYEDFIWKLRFNDGLLKYKYIEENESKDFINYADNIDLVYFHKVFNEILYNKSFILDEDYYEDVHNNFINKIENLILQEELHDLMKDNKVKVNKKRL